MADFSFAIDLICKYEGFNEKAYPNNVTGKEPYTIGYGTQFYPDGTPVKAGQLCTKHKAYEYLLSEVRIINDQLLKLNIGLDDYMRQALISFIHSIGWEPFFYSQIIDAVDREDFYVATEEIGRWVFDENYEVIGGLLNRRKDEIKLFLADLCSDFYQGTEMLLTAFNTYQGNPNQIKAIKILEEKLSPYLLSEFVNNFRLGDELWNEFSNNKETVRF